MMTVTWQFCRKKNAKHGSVHTNFHTVMEKKKKREKTVTDQGKTGRDEGAATMR